MIKRRLRLATVTNGSPWRGLVRHVVNVAYTVPAQIRHFSAHFIFPAIYREYLQ